MSKVAEMMSGLAAAGKSIELSEQEFISISKLILEKAGINLTEQKKPLIQARLIGRIRQFGMNSYRQYVKYVKDDPTQKELITMIDMLTTNKTSFFREAEHFDFIKKNILARRDLKKEPLRVWSAGCSSGQEPYSLTMLLKQEYRNLAKEDAQILATDISVEMVNRTRLGEYEEETMDTIPAAYVRQYFTKVADPASRTKYRVTENLKQHVRVAILNLVSDWPMKGPFDFILCRNVMIYFTGDFRENLVHRYGKLLKPGGYLFIGLSESLGGRTGELKYIQPAIYRKPQ